MFCLATCSGAHISFLLPAPYVRLTSSYTVFVLLVAALFHDGVAPEFVLRPADQVALEGSTVELLCAANGRDESGKPPDITWLKDGVTIDIA